MSDRNVSGKSRPAIEWVFGSMSALLVAALILFLGYQALFADARPPDLAVTVERIDKLNGGSAVTVAIENRGGEAASAVIVTASAPDASNGISRMQIEFDYVAAHAVRRGVFLFSGNVAAQDLLVEVDGYVEP